MKPIHPTSPLSMSSLGKWSNCLKHVGGLWWASALSGLDLRIPQVLKQHQNISKLYRDLSLEDAIELQLAKGADYSCIENLEVCPLTPVPPAINNGTRNDKTP